jgi:hypothetical protein
VERKRKSSSFPMGLLLSAYKPTIGPLFEVGVGEADVNDPKVSMER